MRQWSSTVVLLLTLGAAATGCAGTTDRLTAATPTGAVSSHSAIAEHSRVASSAADPSPGSGPNVAAPDAASSGSASSGGAFSGGASDRPSQTPQDTQTETSSTPGMTAQEWLDAATKTLGNATSVHVTGATTDWVLDLHLGPDSGYGSMDSPDLGKVDLIDVGNVVYVKGTARYWQTVAQAGGNSSVVVFDGSWVAERAGSSGFASLLTLPSFVSSVMSGGPPLTEAIAQRELSGQAVAMLSDAGGGTLFIASAPPHRPVRMVSDNKVDSLDFSDYGAPLHIAPPSSYFDAETGRTVTGAGG